MKDCFKDNVNILSDMLSESVRWIMVDSKAFSEAFTIGSVFAPHEGSSHHSDDIFKYHLTEDIVNIKA